MNNKMRSKRVLMNLSQAELAKKINISRQTIVLIEQERYNPSLNLCLAICYELNSKLDELFWRNKENE
ncbi:MAG: helix-turn-helix transcriptional regulator [Candidatus Izemoplasmatales bacterium]|nr:helix-turn-helix transcriptional regulator [Candidatus Izemoplasmatales bacterium]